MSERTDLRATSSDDDLVFHDYHKPMLPSADYTLSVKHDLTVKAGAKASGSGSLKFRVGGPQLALPEGSVVSTFPADTSSGHFFTALPHVMLSRGVLPWERDGRATSDPDDPRTWLVVLVLDDAEFAAAKLETVKASAVPYYIADGDNHEPRISLLTVDVGLVATHFPTVDDLPWLAHVRSIAPAGGNPGPETATVMSSRLAMPGTRNHAFLLSVEGRYRGATIDVRRRRRVAFPVLHQWTFFCEEEHRHGFVELLTTRDGENVDPTSFRLPDESNSTVAEQRIAAGFVPVRLDDRTGSTSAAWYHGPLLPAPSPVAVGAIDAVLPADRADQLLFVDEDVAMYDLSYAAAWELGRMITLEHSDIATALYHWKRSFAHVQHRASAGDSGVTTMPGGSRWQPFPAMPTKVDEWMRHGIVELREVPFRYLVPDGAMLPTPGFRFFDVDPLWVECLRDGAISVGRTDSRAREIEVDLRDHLPAPAATSGLLLRSGAVSDFPELEIDGYGDPAPDEFFGEPPLPILRMERLAPSVLLVLFAGRVSTVDVHLHSQAVHFGFDRDLSSTSEREIFVKRGVKFGYVKPDPAPPVAMNPSRRILMAELPGLLGIQGSVGQGGVAEFAALMLDGVPLVRFSRALGAS